MLFTLAVQSALVALFSPSVMALEPIDMDERYNYKTYCSIEYSFNGAKTGEALSFVGHLETDDDGYYSTVINRVLPGLDLTFYLRHTLTGPMNGPSEQEPIDISIFKFVFGESPDYFYTEVRLDLGLSSLISNDVKFPPRYVVSTRADSLSYQCWTRYTPTPK